MKKIAIFSGYYLPHLGGVERYTYNLAKQLHNTGYQVVIVSTRYDNELKEVENLEYAKIYRLPIYNIFKSRYPLLKKNKKCRDLLKKIQSEKIDSIILQTRFWTTSYIGSKFAKKNSIPACLIEHGSTHFTVNNKILDFFGEKYEHFLTNLIKRNVKDFYGVSKKCTDWLQHFNIQSKGVFYNSIDSSEFEEYNQSINKNNENVKIAFVGRLIKEKGVLKLIEAFDELKKNFSNLELNIAGSGPLYEELKNKEFKNNINILGNLTHDEVMKLLAKSDVFVNPSYFSEGLPTSILEAALMKCAIIATPMGGTTEIINSDQIGLICGFEIEDIINKLTILLNDKEYRTTLGENANNRVLSDFSWINTTKKLINTIKFRENV